MAFAETVVLHDAIVRIELDDKLGYRLSYGERVIYQNGRRTVRGRSSAYELKSVEQFNKLLSGLDKNAVITLQVKRGETMAFVTISGLTDKG